MKFINRLTAWIKGVAQEEFTKEEAVQVGVVGLCVLVISILSGNGFFACFGLIVGVAGIAGYLEARDVS